MYGRLGGDARISMEVDGPTCVARPGKRRLFIRGLGFDCLNKIQSELESFSMAYLGEGVILLM